MRTLSFSHDSQYLASGSEDLVIDIAHVETGEQAYAVDSKVAVNSVAWHPSRLILAYAGDEKRSSRPDRSSFVKLVTFDV